ncbi:hypothetical protein EVG20_g7418 [Dentipellis fragilis]|uniref:Spindle pole body component n=1 Tax=Dentipellis fragilis TaxID=205917 RepID=A0A4Y9YEJ3_9AGAM|nr:hypothetical protein EVG20_g7418 [Dentipellis fragilis]
MTRRRAGEREEGGDVVKVRSRSRLLKMLWRDRARSSDGRLIALTVLGRATRPSHAHTLNMDPYTPRPAHRRAKGQVYALCEGITGTIASVRRNRQLFEEAEEYGEDYAEPAYATRGSRDSRRRGTAEPSFIAEESFVRAPLNSRVVSGHHSHKGKGKAREPSLDELPQELQEAAILEDLLFVLMGIEGVYITYHEDYSAEDDDPLQGIRFTVSRRLEPSLRDLVERILPLATYYTAISSFIELRSHFDFGLVNHALCAAMRDMLKDYQTLLSQLEHAFNTSPQFTLQKLWFYVHPTVHTLFLIYQLITKLATAADASGSSSSSSSDDEADAALGLGAQS